MYESRVVLCVSNAYEQKYYFNPDFDMLPQTVKDELKIMCVLYTEEIGGILTLVFEEDGSLMLETSAEEADGFYDDIGSVLKIKQLQQEQAELFESLETYFRVFFMDALE